MSDKYFGLYRGVVKDVEDPEKRFRYRVQVYTVHDEMDKEFLPWAETGFCMNASKEKLSADIPNFDVNDVVWIMFEGGDRRFPVITGGWITHNRGANDVPTEQQEDYNKTRKRWQRIDRKGNLIELSELDDELRVKLKSGGAEIIITQKDNSITLKATEGVVRVEAPKAEVVAPQAILDSREVTIRAALTDPTQSLDEPDRRGRAHVLSHVETNIHSQNPEETDQGQINVGGYTPKDKGQVVQTAPPLQTPTYWNKAKVIKIGVKQQTQDGMHTLPHTTEVEIHGVDFVKVNSPKLVDVRVTEDDATINMVNEGDGDINITCEDGGDINIESTKADVNIKAPDAVVNIEGKTEVNVKATEGTLTGEGQQLVDIKSDVKIKLKAPSIEIG